MTTEHDPMTGSLAYRWAKHINPEKVSVHTGYAVAFYDNALQMPTEGLIVVAGSLEVMQKFVEAHKLTARVKEKAQAVVVAKRTDYSIEPTSPVPTPAPAVNPLDQDDEDDW